MFSVLSNEVTYINPIKKLPTRSPFEEICGFQTDIMSRVEIETDSLVDGQELSDDFGEGDSSYYSGEEHSKQTGDEVSRGFVSDTQKKAEKRFQQV